ncbi:hypothetical protein HDU79_002712 [Rhizoclosmatium sp. JEL0117]|nr:hypothetical protein HDU79_002712 [Rhizoclosmatium sp. JEL0117]
MSKDRTPPTFTAASTAEQVADAFQEDCLGKTVIVTGANTGIGLETAKQLAGHGATVVLTSRSEKNGEEAIASIKKVYPTANAVCYSLDLSSLKSVKAFADQFIANHSQLHILVNNAGVMACPKSLTVDGFETQFGVNHLGHFYLTQLLLPLLLKTGTAQTPARIVNLSSTAQHLFAPKEGILFDDLDASKAYSPWVRYGHSKLANVLFAKELNNRYRLQHVVSVSLHPGVIFSSDLYRYSSFSSLMNAVANILKRPKELLRNLTERSKTIPEGAATTVLCALGPVEGGGYYYDCKMSKGEGLHSKANDAELANKLWEVSEKLIAEKL